MSQAGPGGAEAKARVATYSDHVDLLADPNVDAVVITTPNFTHATVLADALASDKHVLIEKPLCTTVEDCMKVVEAAEGRDAITWMGLQYRFMPTPAAMLDQLETGVCGTTHMVSIREHRYPFLDKVGDWNRFTRNTGGTLVEKCCHFFDLMHLVAGAHPVRVMASGGQDVNHLDEVLRGRWSHGALRHPRQRIRDRRVRQRCAGACSTCACSRKAADTSRRSRSPATWPRSKRPFRVTRCGSVSVPNRNATDTTSGGGVREVPAPMDTRVPYPDFHQGASYMEHLHLADAIRAGRPASVTLTEGMWAVATGAAAHRSIDERRPVELSEFGLG